MNKLVFILMLALPLASPLFAQYTASSATDVVSLNLTTLGTPTASWVAHVHDFGDITVGEKVSHTFTFTNTGDKPLLVEKVKPSCGCTVAEYSEEAIAPGEQGYVTAFFQAKGAGHFTKTVSVTTNEGGTPIVLQIKGQGIAAATEGN